MPKFAKSKITLEYQYKGDRKLSAKLPLADFLMVKNWIERMFQIDWNEEEKVEEE